MNGVCLYFVNKHLSSWPLLELQDVRLLQTYMSVAKNCPQVSFIHSFAMLLLISMFYKKCFQGKISAGPTEFSLEIPVLLFTLSQTTNFRLFQLEIACNSLK